MGEPTTNALASMPMPQRTMTQTMGRFRKIRLRPSKRDFLRAWRTKCASNPQIARLEVTTAASAAASLRSVRTKIQNLRSGNDTRWKTPKASFPPHLEIGQKAPDSHISTASTTTSTSFPHKPSRSPPQRIHVDGCRSLRSRSHPPASLRSERDRHGAESLIGSDPN